MILIFKVFIASLQCLLIMVQARSRLDNPWNNRLVATWGANSVNSQTQDPNFYEKSLSTVCGYADIVHIYGVLQFYEQASGNVLLGMGLANHCNVAYPGYNKPASGFVPLQCNQIASDIKACQAAGKKILISIVNSISPPVMKSDADGIALADALWAMFLGGSGTVRPFGSDVFLDGIDLWVLDNVAVGYNALVGRMRTLMDSDHSRKTPYLIAGSPRCSFPDPIMGPNVANSPLAENSAAFDYLNIYARSSPDCSFLNKELFFSTFSKWSNWTGDNMPLFIAVPANDYVSAPGDYVTVSQLSEMVSGVKNNAGKVVGFGIWDFSVDWQTQPCTNNPSLTYAQLLKGKFGGDDATLAACKTGPYSNSILPSGPRQSSSSRVGGSGKADISSGANPSYLGVNTFVQGVISLFALFAVLVIL